MRADHLRERVVRVEARVVEDLAHPGVEDRGVVHPEGDQVLGLQLALAQSLQRQEEDEIEERLCRRDLTRAGCLLAHAQHGRTEHLARHKMRELFDNLPTQRLQWRQASEAAE